MYNDVEKLLKWCVQNPAQKLIKLKENSTCTECNAYARLQNEGTIVFPTSVIGMLSLKELAISQSIVRGLGTPVRVVPLCPERDGLLRSSLGLEAPIVHFESEALTKVGPFVASKRRLDIS